MQLSERLARETGRDYALRIIKENIISLDLAPGSPISENELAAELGLSRTPVREALIELAKVKIVEITPQKKSLVAPIDYELVEESRFMRNVLECAVVKWRTLRTSSGCGKISSFKISIWTTSTPSRSWLWTMIFIGPSLRSPGKARSTS